MAKARTLLCHLTQWESRPYLPQVLPQPSFGEGLHSALRGSGERPPSPRCVPAPSLPAPRCAPPCLSCLQASILYGPACTYAPIMCLLCMHARFKASRAVVCHPAVLNAPLQLAWLTTNDIQQLGSQGAQPHPFLQRWPRNLYYGRLVLQSFECLSTPSLPSSSFKVCPLSNFSPACPSTSFIMFQLHILSSPCPVLSGCPHTVTSPSPPLSPRVGRAVSIFDPAAVDSVVASAGGSSDAAMMMQPPPSPRGRVSILEPAASSTSPSGQQQQGIHSSCCKCYRVTQLQACCRNYKSVKSWQ